MYPGDSRTTWPKETLPDSRVEHRWDEEKVVGLWYASQESGMEPKIVEGSRGLGNEVLWDSWLLYRPDAKWEDGEKGLRTWGRTIIGTRDQMKAAVEAAVKGS